MVVHLDRPNPDDMEFAVLALLAIAGRKPDQKQPNKFYLGVNTPSTKADGFSDKLCGNPLAWRLTGRSIREISTTQNDLSRSETKH